ncbi:phosphoenolpyruvate--protein phosphotransferase [Sphingomonas hylomeconis]|uniref:phosphoenolpyruvate--protein phosphotransferase n=1 Tax=Sphingomonas hylomeconis TaxID=1395958 RepID=A0ABV7T2W1_9SPHN|nr:phosphoenolpyruvate--protein phosphotransferase [Sphingomonas hylomeconis]
MSAAAIGPEIEIRAPFSGMLRLLSDVPDAAFAQGLVGEGLAIDPLEERVRAPIDGVIVGLAATGHSVTVKHAHGIEVLIHVGIDTVALGGRGFEPLVAIGQQVRCGDALLRFDADTVGAGAASLLTPILIVGGATLKPAARTPGPIRAGDILFSAIASASPTATDAAGVASDASRSTAHVFVTLTLPHGLHARPSARIAELARRQTATITLSCDGRTADAGSTTNLMTLDARLGAELEIRAVGGQARESALAIADLLETLGAAEAQLVAQAATTAEHRPGRLPPPAAAGRIAGVVASPGLAMGTIFRLDGIDQAVPETGHGVAQERAALDGAVAALSAGLGDTIARATGAAVDIAEAHLAILSDAALVAAADSAIGDGASAAAAWRHASRRQEAELAASANARLRERAIDLRDVERRLLATLSGDDATGALLPPPGAIVLCDELAPSFLIGLPEGLIAGICTARGGTTSHAAILAAAAGIPMLVAAGDRVLALEAGQKAMLDADDGWLDPSPDAALLAWFDAEQARSRDARAQLLQGAAQDCRLADGARIEVFANIGSVADATAAVAQGAEGCGLLRTEFLFAEAASAPDEESQRASYAAIAAALQGRPLIIRTLDVGGDKPLPYLAMPAEENPALGMRGIRVSLQAPDLLRTQLRAILRGVPAEQLRIMLPMVVDVGEIEQVRAIAREECARLGDFPFPQIGIMVETPAAVLLADQLAQHADFLSIGSNDLTQYVLAMDRGNAALVSRVDALHPAVIAAIALTGAAARRHGRWLGLCGGMASDARVAPLLVGLGCVELSAVPRAIPEIKRVLARWSADDCRALADRARGLQSADAVRALLVEESR